MRRAAVAFLAGAVLAVAGCGGGSGPTQEQEDCYAQNISTFRVANLKQAELWDHELANAMAIAALMEAEALMGEGGRTFIDWFLDAYPQGDEAALRELVTIRVCFGSDRVHEWADR